MKCQFWSMDAIFAMVIFGIAIVLVTFVWYNISNQFALASGYGVEGMQAQLQGLQARLLSQGMPPDWNNLVDTGNTATWNNISIGLGGEGQGTLSTQKVMTLMAMSNYDYQATKPELGVGFDYYITIRGGAIDLRIGRSPELKNAVSEQVSTVPVDIGGSQAYMQVIVWTNTSFGVT